jgi:hypothetical protein
MSQAPSTLSRIVAGIIVARCRCCREPQPLESHPELDATRRYCPGSAVIYLDRGDGLFEPTPDRLTTRSPQSPAEEPDVVSDRPRRTGPKERITLERATFAAGKGR